MDDLQFIMKTDLQKKCYVLELLGEYEDWKSLIPDIENLVGETGGQVFKKHFKSMYNSYVDYDYEPIPAKGFTLSLDLDYQDENNEKFFEYLLGDRVDTLNSLNRQFAMEVI